MTRKLVRLTITIDDRPGAGPEDWRAALQRYLDDVAPEYRPVVGVGTIRRAPAWRRALETVGEWLLRTAGIPTIRRRP